jgi:hypothetical protein
VLGAANFFRSLDSFVVDSGIVGMARATQDLSQFLRTAVSGNAQHYALIMAAGMVVLLAAAIFLS